MSETKEKELTEKQKLFCEYYIENWNGADAARRAGYSEDTAREIASQNLTKPHIKEYIEEIQKDLAKIAGISRLSIIKDLQTIKEYAEQDKDKIKALEVVNKMLGFNEPEKHEVVTYDIVADKPEHLQEEL